MAIFFKQVFIFFVLILFVLIYPRHTNGIERLSRGSAQLQPGSLTKENDIRVKILRDYLNQYFSPLSANAKDFVEYADAFNLDWRLVASISGVESTFGKFIPNNSYNAWGWGVYGNNVILFSSWREGIETVSRGLRENYLNKIGSDNIYRIGRWYAASPRWAANVEFFMNKIAEFQSDKATYNLSISL